MPIPSIMFNRWKIKIKNGRMYKILTKENLWIFHWQIEMKRQTKCRLIRIAPFILNNQSKSKCRRNLIVKKVHKAPIVLIALNQAIQIIRRKNSSFSKIENKCQWSKRLKIIELLVTIVCSLSNNSVPIIHIWKHPTFYHRHQTNCLQLMHIIRVKNKRY